MAVTGQRQFASVVTALSQDAFVGSSIENRATILACDLRKRDVPRALGTTTLICWRKAPYHVDMHARSTCHHPMLSRCIGAPGAYRDGQNPRRDCTPARQGVSTSQQMSHSILRLSWALAVVCGVSRRHLALRCSGLFLIPMPKSSMRSDGWMTLARRCHPQRRGCGHCLPSLLRLRGLLTATTRWARIPVKWLRVLQIPLTSCRIGRNLILQCTTLAFT